MNNRFAILVIALSLLAAVAGLVLNALVAGSAWGGLLLTYGLAAGQMAGLYLLLRNGTLTGTVYFRIMLGLLGLAIIGVLFTILHWAGGRVLLVGPLVGIALTYTVRFAYKPRKSLLDVLKLLWVLVAYVGGALVSQHLVGREVAYLAQVLLWLAVVEFVRVGRQTNGLYQDEQDEQEE